MLRRTSPYFTHMSKQLSVQPTTAAPTASLARVWDRVALVAVIVLATWLALVHLPYAPRTWFDEGSHLHVPKTLVQYGVYADISSEGFRYFGPTIGVGPTVMLPIALVYRLVGIGLVEGRLVIVAYMALALLALYLLARRLHGGRIALLTLLLLIASRTIGYEGMVEYGRQVLGEVPGIAFLGLGLLAWTAALFRREHSALLSIASGLAFGLALVTKNQFVLIVPPTLVVLAFLDWRYYRAGDWWLRIAPVVVAGACFALWTLINLTFLGPADFFENLAKTRQAAGGAIFVFDFLATRRAGWYLLQVYGGLLLPGLAYGLWRARARTPHALAELAPTLLASLWIVWFLGSLGWPRYAFPAVALGALAVARLIADGFSMLRNRQPILASLAVLYLIVAIGGPLALTTRTMLSPDDSAQRMAAYLDANVPQATIVETWEPELGVLTDHRYHYPPTELLDPAVRNAWLGGPPLAYDGLSAQPEYVVVGAFGVWVNIYDGAILERDYVIEYQADPYVLFRRVSP